MWEPSETSFPEQEYTMTIFRGEFIISENIIRGQHIINSLSTGEYDAVDFTDDENFFNDLNDQVNMDRVGTLKLIHGVTSDSLSQKWLISTEAERITVQHTTQRGIRMILHPSLLCRLKTNNRALMYNRLQ